MKVRVRSTETGHSRFNHCLFEAEYNQLTSGASNNETEDSKVDEMIKSQMIKDCPREPWALSWYVGKGLASE